MGNTCKPMAVSFQCMTKFTTNKKKIQGQKKKNLYFEELTKILKNTDHLLLGFRGFANFMHSFIYSFFFIQLILAGPTVCRTLPGVSGAE